MPSESAKLSAFQLASILASYGAMFGYGSPLQMLAEQLKDSAQGSIMAQAQLVAQKRAQPKGLKKILGDLSPLLVLATAFANPVAGATAGIASSIAKQASISTPPEKLQIKNIYENPYPYITESSTDISNIYSKLILGNNYLNPYYYYP